ncbi:Endocytosis and vacuole integrity protein, partial [Coemansia furcata]
ELQNLCTEARRKHPDIKEAAERVIVVLRGIKTTGIEEIASELSKSDEVIRPFVLACRSNNQRLTSIAMHCLQQLVSRQAISPGSIRETLTTLSFVSAQGVVDVQVKVLQMVLPLVTIYGEGVCGETLVEAFALCLALQRSRDPIVSNTAAAILRQVVVAVFDRVVAEDRELGVSEGDQDLTRKSAKDAYYVLQDLCLLVSDIEPIFIRIDHAVDKRLVLELIESVLTNHAGVVSQHAAMAQTLRERLAPFIVGFFAERASFALAVRSIRIAWLFVRDLHTHLPAECEIILSVFSRLVDSGAAATPNGSGSGKRRASLSTKTAVGSAGFPLFYRVLALEVVRDLLENAPLLHKLYSLYDGRVADEGEGKEEDCHVILDLVSAISRVAVERGDLRSANGSIPSALSDHTLAVGDAASTDILAQQIGASTCRMRLEMYKLLDKQDPPNVPDTYMFYLAASAVISFSEGLVGDILPRCTERISCQPLHSGNRQLTEASVLGAVTEPGVVGGFVRHAWAAVFSAYDFMAGVRFDDHLFARMLESAQKLAETAGALGMNEARDTMLALLCSGCLPAASSGEMMIPNSRQVQCLRAVIGCTLYLASALGPAWYMVLATVQQVEESLYLSRGKHSASTPIIGSDDSVASSDLKTVRDEFARLLAFVRAHNGDAILWLIRGLRVLGSDISGIAVQLDEAEEMRRLRALALGSAPALIQQQQRGSSLDRPTFAIEELRGFAVSNVDLLMGAAASDVGEQAWAAIIDDLLATATDSEAAPGLRTQACEALADVVLAAMALVTQADTLPPSFQALVESGSAQVRILQPLSLMMARGEHAGVRRLTLDTLHRVLQASGHSITRAWGVVFDIVESTAEGHHSSLMRS